MDQVLALSKQYKSIAEQKSIYYNQLEKALQTVNQYIKDNNLIVYGGLAIDIALKLAGHIGIYKDNVVPDYDVYSDDLFTYIKYEWVINDYIASDFYTISNRLIHGYIISQRKEKLKIIKSL